MRAVAFLDHRGSDVIEVRELDCLDVGPRDVRVAVKAAALNPTDLLLCAGEPPIMRDRMIGRPRPFVPGYDLAGRVESVGLQVDRDTFGVGDRVVGVVPPSMLRGRWCASTRA